MGNDSQDISVVEVYEALEGFVETLTESEIALFASDRDGDRVRSARYYELLARSGRHESGLRVATRTMPSPAPATATIPAPPAPAASSAVRTARFAALVAVSNAAAAVARAIDVGEGGCR